MPCNRAHATYLSLDPVPDKPGVWSAGGPGLGGVVFYRWCFRRLCFKALFPPLPPLRDRREGTEGEVDRLEAMVKEKMEKVMDLAAPLVVDIGIGPNWDAAH
jgi:hypothetical protein